KTSQGRAVQNLMQIPPDAKIRTIITIKELQEKEYVDTHYIVLCTRKGIIKKTRVADVSRPRQNGINAITINEGDQLLGACLTDGNQNIMMALKRDRPLRFPEEKVRPTGRGAIGVFGISLDTKVDEVVGMICVNESDADTTVLVVSAKGFGKRTKVEEYRITNRGGKGVKTINITEKTGDLVGLLNVNETQDLMITCKSGVTIRTSIASIRVAGRATQGVKLIRLDENDEIAAITQLNDRELDEEESTEDLVEGGNGSFIATEKNSGTGEIENSAEDLPENESNTPDSEEENNKDEAN